MANAHLSAEHLDDPITRHMRTRVTTLSADHTVEQALAALRSEQLEEQILYLYVVEPDGTLIGVVPTRRLLTAQPGQAIRQIMQGRVVTVPAEASVQVACEFFVMYRFLAFPVVDSANKLLGVVDVSLFTDEVFGLAEQRQLGDVFHLIGVHLSQARRASPVRNFRARFPWLLANIAGGIACAAIASLFEPLLRAVIVLALFVPIVLALAESVSMQSMTITLTTLHGRRVNWGRFARAIGREFLTAALLGAASGGVVGGHRLGVARPAAGRAGHLRQHRHVDDHRLPAGRGPAVGGACSSRGSEDRRRADHPGRRRHRHAAFLFHAGRLDRELTARGGGPARFAGDGKLTGRPRALRIPADATPARACDCFSPLRNMRCPATA